MAFLVLAGVFILSIFVILLCWSALPEVFRINESADYIVFYEPVARNLLAGRGLIGTDGTIAVRYPPGYPFILAGIFGLSKLLNIPENIALSAFILLGMGLASVLVYLLARIVWGTFPALFSSLVWITYPFTLWLTKQPNSEVPFLAFFYGSFCLFWYGLLRRRRSWIFYFVSGLLVGLAMLIRAIAIGAGVVMGAIIWLVARRLRVRLRLFLIAMLLLGNFVAILPWEGWVYFRTGKIIPLSTGGVLRDGLTFAVAPWSWRRGVRVPPDVELLMKDIYAHYDELQSFRDVVLFMVGELRRRPLVVAKLYIIKAARSWYGTDSQRFETLTLVFQIPYLFLILGGTITAWKLGGAVRQLAISIWLMVLYFWGVDTMFTSILRYTVPVMGLLFIIMPYSFLRMTAPESKANEKAV